MPAYNFKKQFVRFVESGEKTHTIRAHRKTDPKPGDRLTLYYGMRTKQCRKLLEAVCTKIERIEIGYYGNTNATFIKIDGTLLAADELDTLAVRDGFKEHHDMMKFWDGRIPFVGIIIHWRPA